MADPLARLEELENGRELSIIKLSEPILVPHYNQDGDDKRASNASSNDASEIPTPASLEADLAHYRDLFTKLRFSYVEQVTKEKFLRAVVGDPPLHVTPSANAALEAELATMKANLKAQKTEVAEMIVELEKQGRALAQRHSVIQIKSQELRNLPPALDALNKSIAALREEQGLGEDGKDADQVLPLAGTQRLVEQKERELELLNQQLLTADAEADRKQRELQRLHDELVPLQAQETQALSAAKEAQRRKEDGIGSLGDELEQQARWLQSSETILRNLLET